MTPQEKAQKLTDSFYQLFPFNKHVVTTDGELSWEYDNWSESKKAALIAVDNIIDALDVHQWQNKKEIDYWQEVKTEVEKL